VDIEDRAEKWAAEYIEKHQLDEANITYIGIENVLTEAYLAGSAQTQRDYVAHYESRGR